MEVRMKPIEAYGYFFVEPLQPFERRSFAIDSVADDEAVVKVAACGLCHTDIGFYEGHVKTNQLPVVLGHEISGHVVAAGKRYAGLVGAAVVVPAVLPCGECELCRAGRSNVCRSQKMPGNDLHGGFASHIKVPARFLCRLPEDLRGFNITHLSVVADAVTTPFQSLKRSNLKRGELAIVIGVGGLGTYMVQHARNAGARVIAIDIDEKKLDAARKMGAELTVNAAGSDEKTVKKTIQNWAADNKLPRVGWKIFEMSGTAQGQTTAFSLLTFAGTLGVVGFTMDKVNVRLSNLMAFDADLFGNWGCKPEHYPAAVDDVLAGRINISDNIEEHPLDSINEIIGLALAHKLEKRVVFVP
jgi:6-hydroxycyclohex-1-ene-1-carbonyl-CoA dehydrogenase